MIPIIFVKKRLCTPNLSYQISATARSGYKHSMKVKSLSFSARNFQKKKLTTAAYFADDDTLLFSHDRRFQMTVLSDVKLSLESLLNRLLRTKRIELTIHQDSSD